MKIKKLTAQINLGSFFDQSFLIKLYVSVSVCGVGGE